MSTDNSETITREGGTATANPQLAQPDNAARRYGRKSRCMALAAMVLVATAAVLSFQNGIGPNLTAHGTSLHEHQSEARNNVPRVTTVKVVHPKRNTSAEITLERIAIVEPYYRADLRARASGIVKTVFYDIGEEVKRGATLVEIDVAESEQDVAQKKASVVQREQEMKVSEAKLRDTQAALKVTIAAVSQRQAEVQAISATRDLKKRKLDRYRELASRGSVVGSVVEEEERDYLASEAGVLAAQSNVERARADQQESVSKIETAAAEVELKRSQIEVARRELERSQVVADYGKIVAPFDGVVVRRNVDPGSFVQNATTGSSETLISVSRIDLLTIVAQFPDNAAPYVMQGIPAVIQITDQAGPAILSKLTRVSPSIQNSDRTIRVEIDLFNGGPDARTLRRQQISNGTSGLQLKGSADSFPEAAFMQDSEAKRLLPGMNAVVRLPIAGSGTSTILPSTAVFSRGGAKYILLVVDGKTRMAPVRVHMNDGQNVRISVVNQKSTDDGTAVEELVALQGTEQVVVSNQLQVGEGTDVQTSLSNW